MVESITVDSRFGGEVTIKKFETTDSLCVMPPSGSFRVRGDRMNVTYKRYGSENIYARCFLWDDSHLMAGIVLDTHLARRLDVWLSHNVAEHTTTPLGEK